MSNWQRELTRTQKPTVSSKSNRSVKRHEDRIDLAIKVTGIVFVSFIVLSMIDFHITHLVLNQDGSACYINTGCVPGE